MIRFWVIRSLMRGVNSFRGQNPHYRCMAFLMDSAVIRTVLAPGISALPAAWTSTADSPIASGEDRLLETGLPGCPYRVRRTTVYRWKPGIWLAAALSSFSGAGGSSGVGPTSRLFTIVLGEQLGK